MPSTSSTRLRDDAGDAATLADRIATLEHELGRREDLDAIRALQHAYGYFIDKGMYAETVDCFAEDGEVRFFGGVFRGRESVRRLYCDRFRERFTHGKNGPIYGQLLDHMIMQDIVDVAADRATAQGRFRCFLAGGAHAECANPTRQWWEGGLYENTYVREDGVWKIKVLDYRPQWHATFENGWAYTPHNFVPFFDTTFPDAPEGPDALIPDPILWPETEVLPFHYAHPVTGKRIKTPKPGRAKGARKR